MTLQTKLGYSLLAIRLSVAAFLMVWVTEKLVAPDLARRVAETFYAHSPSDTQLLVSGLLQGAVVLAFAAGAFRFWSYGAVLLMHATGTFSTVGRLLDPYTLPNHLFWAAVPTLVAIAVLFVLRHEDRYLSVDAARNAGRAAA